MSVVNFPKPFTRGARTPCSLMKDVVRHAAMNVRSRVVATEVVSQWRRWLEEQEPAVEAVYASEREEREMRLAEADATRAGNLLEHEDEIKGIELILVLDSVYFRRSRGSLCVCVCGGGE
jgi:hypothetical protein